MVVRCMLSPETGEDPLALVFGVARPKPPGEARTLVATGKAAAQPATAAARASLWRLMSSPPHPTGYGSRQPFSSTPVCPTAVNLLGPLWYPWPSTESDGHLIET